MGAAFGPRLFAVQFKSSPKKKGASHFTGVQPAEDRGDTGKRWEKCSPPLILFPLPLLQPPVLPGSSGAGTGRGSVDEHMGPCPCVCIISGPIVFGRFQRMKKDKR